MRAVVRKPGCSVGFFTDLIATGMNGKGAWSTGMYYRFLPGPCIAFDVVSGMCKNALMLIGEDSQMVFLSNSGDCPPPPKMTQDFHQSEILIAFSGNP